MKNLYIKLCLLALSAFFAQNLHAHDFEVSGIYYNIISTNEYEVEVTYGDYPYSGYIDIPETVNYESTTYHVTTIGQYAFMGDTELTGVKVSTNIRGVKFGAFANCQKLAEINLPNVTYIEAAAFSDCSNLTTVNAPNVASVGGGTEPFSGCNKLNSIIYSSTCFVYLPRDYSGHYKIPDGIQCIAPSAFRGCTGLTSIEIPSSVTNISTGAFSFCGGLTSVEIPSSVTTIESSVFSCCYNLTQVNLPPKIQYVYPGLFYLCEKLTEIYIHSNITYIGEGAFQSTGLKNVIIPSSVTKIESNAFAHCDSLKDVTIQGSPTIIPDAFIGTPYFNDWYNKQPDGLVYIDNIAYKYKGTMPANTSIEIKEGTTTLWSDLFSKCGENLSSINIPESVTSINANAFSGCNGLTELYIPQSVKVIDVRAFQNCTGLNSITIPSNCHVYSTAFSGCINLRSIFTENDSHALFFCWNYLPQASTYNVETKELLAKPTLEIATSTATSLVLKANCCTKIKTTIFGLVDDLGETHIKEGNTIALTGLKPNTGYKVYMKIVNEYNDEYGTSEKYYYTTSLTLTTAQPKVISAGNVLVSAETNIDPAETNVGFEWRRTDWTDDFASNTGKGYVNGESVEGKIKNLYTEKLWKYRPYYKSNDGTYYYGDWVGIDPTNTSWFEPTVHTYADFSVDGNTVLLKGYTLSGTDNVTEQGFKYWKNSAAAAKGTWYATTVDAASVPADALTVAAAGELMSAELTGLDYNSVYYYAAYVKTSTGETFYGEQRSFTIGENPTGIIVVKQDIEEESQTLSTRPIIAGWYTLDGRKLQTAPTRSGIYIHNGKKISLR